MKKFFRGLAIVAICGATFFGFDFDKVEAAENFDADFSAIIDEDLNIDSKAIHIRFGQSPGRHQPPPPRFGPPHHRYNPPSPHRRFPPPPPPPRRYGPHPRR